MKDKYIKEIVGVLSNNGFYHQSDKKYYVVDFSKVATLISKIPCPKCKETTRLYTNCIDDKSKLKVQIRELKDEVEALREYNRDKEQRLDTAGRRGEELYLEISKLKDDMKYAKEVNDELCAENKRLEDEVKWSKQRDRNYVDDNGIYHGD